MAKKLIIVESPTKAKTISRFLGKDFNIQASYGHLRDLPKSKMGIDIEHDFAPQYIIPKANEKTVAKLKKLALSSPTIYFATDEDREGEAIAWHLLETFKMSAGKSKEKIDPAELEKKSERIVFHEITEEAIKEALKNPRDIDLHMVDAQQARRILDRLVGYELSPFLWKKVAKGLSAGRVQSVALRLTAEREREILKFNKQEYWSVEGQFKKKTGSNEEFPAKLSKIDDKNLDKMAIQNEGQAKKILDELKGTEFKVTDIQSRQTKKNPPAPLTTSALQQEANRKLGYSARQTMFIAQQLYEGVELGSKGPEGLISYMRTDSLNLAEKFLAEAQTFLREQFGDKYSLAEPRRFKAKSKLAQEAHEAIRPTDIRRRPEDLKDYLDARQLKLYTMIWQRTLASQMPEAIIDAVGIYINDKNNKYTFRASGSTVKFDGYMKVYNNTKDIILPPLAKEEGLEAVKVEPIQHFTEPPARYSEAGLVKALEEHGIGRPSTYAPTIATLVDRNYVEKEDKRLKPTEIGLLVNDVLVKHFPKIVDYKFTAHMEDDLDQIADGKMAWVPVIKEFYEPFKENLMKKHDEVDKKELTEQATDKVCEKCGKPMVIKMGRFGKFLACSGYPECKNTKPIDQNGEIVKNTEPQGADAKCEKCGKPMVMKHGRFGPFLACSGYPECKNIKNIEKKTGVACPQCGKGDIVAKRSKRGRTFFACNKYPDCKFALWSKPNGEKCPDCGSLLTFAAGSKVRCSNKECKFTKDTE
ncbi:MAG: type I DNA topoisomerase [Patescibacteria group bacterium]|jgi:DNA topoisomerase-1